MLKYFAAATTLKLFSISPQTKRAYRYLGNILGQRFRLTHGLDKWRMMHARETLELCERHHAIQTGDRLLEIGTGWVHWEATIIRLFYDVEITLFDTWDNRQFEAYKRYFQLFERAMDEELGLDQAQSTRAHRLLQVIQKANSFDEIYSTLGFSYVVNPTGTLERFEDEAFSVIFSCNVLEHINRGILPEFIRDIHRLLKSGGYSIQAIDLGDHLAYYNGRLSLKNYLRFSDTVWRRFFENDVQYFNRVQRPEWLALFREAGFQLVEEVTVLTDIDSIKVNKSYENLDKEDLQCFSLTCVHKRPDRNAWSQEAAI